MGVLKQFVTSTASNKTKCSYATLSGGQGADVQKAGNVVVVVVAVTFAAVVEVVVVSSLGFQHFRALSRHRLAPP